MLRQSGAYSSSSRGAYGASIAGRGGTTPFFGVARKHVINRLFTVHSILLLVLGLLGALFPEILVYVLHHSAEGYHARHEGGDVRIAFIIMRIFGCFLLAQVGPLPPPPPGAQQLIQTARFSSIQSTHPPIKSYLLHVIKTVTDGVIRRAFVQSYCAAFALTTLALGRAQLTETNPVRLSNWLVILVFAALTGAYAWFAFFERVAVFELGR